MSSEWKTIGFFPLVGWVNVYHDEELGYWTDSCPGVILQEDPYNDPSTRLVFADCGDGTVELFPVDQHGRGYYLQTTTAEEHESWLSRNSISSSAM
jgi:hypothetical protein